MIVLCSNMAYFVFENIGSIFCIICVASGDQSQAMADYQAKLAEYYKSMGQQPPQQQ